MRHKSLILPLSEKNMNKSPGYWEWRPIHTVPLRLRLSCITTGGLTSVNVRPRPTVAPTIAEPTSVLKVELLVSWGVSKSRSGKSAASVYREKKMPTESPRIPEKSPAGSITDAAGRVSPVAASIRSKDKA